jgi:hypothetical protein
MHCIGLYKSSDNNGVIFYGVLGKGYGIMGFISMPTI